MNPSMRHGATQTMAEVNGLTFAVTRCADACSRLLFAWLPHFLSAGRVSLRSLAAGLSSAALSEYWNVALFFFLTATEAVSRSAQVALRGMEEWLQMLGGVLESFKMVGHLSCHVAWRMKDELHRGLVVACYILQQTCEGVVIAFSLVLYFLNTVVNVLLIATQNCLSAMVGIWDTVSGPVHKVVEMALTLMTFLYSCLVGASVLLWAPCQLLLDFLETLGRCFAAVFVVDSYGFLAATAVTALTLLLLNHRLRLFTVRFGLRMIAALPRVVQTSTRQLYTATAELALARTATDTDTQGPTSEVHLTSSDVHGRSDVLRSDVQQDGNPVRGSQSLAAVDGDLRSLLNEQEERKKCVVCQDANKTVLLLPCRHLCLCRLCADILTQRRPTQRRCCPLCRQNITQTLDVFL